MPSVTGIARRRITAEIIPKVVARLNDNFNVLDIGSGINNWKSYFDGARLMVYDTIELKEELPATFHGDFFTIDLKNEYSCLIATEFLEHVPDPRIFLSRAHSLIKKDGYLILSFPFLFKIVCGALFF